MPYQATENPREDIRSSAFLPELIRGMVVTTRHFLRNLWGQRDPNPRVLDRAGKNQVTTIQYPEEKVPYPPGYRGLHRLVPRTDGQPRCVACYMCATVCPAQCIYIEAGEYAPSNPSAESRVIEKYPTAFVIDELRCIVCGFCVEACPKDAIRMDRSAYMFEEPRAAAGPGGPEYNPTFGHAPSGYARKDFVFDISSLLGGPPVGHPSDPWNKRQGSGPPPHLPKEAHARIHGGAVALRAPPPEEPAAPAPNQRRYEVDTRRPVPVTRFYK
ncbi:MAG: 4Fe-4S binding protein [Myxococcales bacterium]|nr:4Fe-4S binding protein [Myxococcales bacterium]